MAKVKCHEFVISVWIQMNLSSCINVFLIK
uniref:Uncharacterized protein n=1 Tax=Tetranychus urticae TaxID=32264 RepID=T1JZJ3_TETUR